MRVVSLLSSATEIIRELGLDDQVVGSLGLLAHRLDPQIHRFPTTESGR